MTRAGAIALMLVCWLPHSSEAQSRETQRHRHDDPEGRLMAFYAAALAVSAVGTGVAQSPWSVTVGLELSHIPRLSRAQRTAGFDKPESSNLTPVLPRPRVALSTPGGVRVEGSWLPPIAVFDGRAHLYSIAISRAIDAPGGVAIAPRLTASGGRARGAITCNDALSRGTPSEQVYYGAVCHGRESDDYFEPRQLSAELIVSRRGPARFTPFATIGLRRADTRFDIGVQTADGVRDPDHPILLMRATRPFLASGAVWRAWRSEAAAELFYVPGSLLTVRVRVDVLVHDGREPVRGR